MKNDIKLFIEMFNDDERYRFRSLGDGTRSYTFKQIAFVLHKANELGIRATARMLKIPRRTIQRWCRKYNYPVKRCPNWVYHWAYRRRIKRRKYY
jgi:transposase-like protein